MFDDFLENKDTWIKENNSDIVISTRIRLARNISDYPFPLRATSSHKKEILDYFKTVYTSIPGLSDALFVDISSLSTLDRYFLLERHLISQEFLSNIGERGVIISPDQSISIMINEEDHLRIQIIKGGMNLDKAWETINKLDNYLSKKVKYAFSSQLGYLTSCPTNVGTGLRASCMLHLPALVLTKRINKILELLSKISFTVRGFFGEGTQAIGNFFQISNQVSLGATEEELKDNLKGIIKQIETQEYGAREFLLKKYRLSLEDNVWRALGVLSHCRLISSNEALAHLSLLRLGVDLGIIKKIKKEAISDLFIVIQPAHLQKYEGRVLTDQERDYIRAAVLRKRLGG